MFRKIISKNLAGLACEIIFLTNYKRHWGLEKGLLLGKREQRNLFLQKPF
jgi:hypothetical protein